MKQTTKPPLLSSEFCRAFSLSKQEFLAESKQKGMMKQCGAAYIKANVQLPEYSLSLPADKAQIETFQVASDGSCTALGTNSELIQAFTSSAENMAKAVLKALHDFGVEVEGTPYLTTSITRCDEINGNAHFDDEQYIANDGVGFVAIIGDRGGTRVAKEPIPYATIIDDGVPVTFDDESANKFDQGTLQVDESEPEKLLIFPQFAQLHAGPALASAGLSGVRRLMVMRGKTKVKNSAILEAPKPKRRRRRA